MNLNLTISVRVLCVCAALTILPFPVSLYGAQPGFPFVEDFQSQSFLDSTRTTARWAGGGVTLGYAQGRHAVNLGLNLRDLRIGNSSATTGISDIAIEDMDGDGRLDVIVASSNGIFIYFIDEIDDLASVPALRITTDAAFKAMAFGDFDRDGDLDIAAAGDVSAVIFYENTGRRRAFDPRSRVSNVRTIALASADMDGDGDLDLVLAQRKGSAVRVHMNDGEGRFRLREDAIPMTNGKNKVLEVGDLDSDGDLDIVLAKAGGVNVFHLNDGKGDFNDAQLLRHAGDHSDYRGIALGDVDNDGHLDIVIGAHQSANLLYLNNGHAGFSTGSRIDNNAARTIGVELADMDGDGDLDIVEGNSKKGSRVYVNQGSEFDPEGSIIGGKTNVFAVGDVDRDGYPGVIRGRTPAELKVARLTDRRTAPSTMPPYDTGHGRVVSDKVNGDAPAPHIVYLTATAVQPVHTDIEYYLSNDGGGHWRRAYPGESVRFLSPGDDLRWRAELKSRSSTLSATLTQIGIGDVLQVSVDGRVLEDDRRYTATSHNTSESFEPVPIRLVNRGDRAIAITGIETVGEGFEVRDEQGRPLPRTLMPGGEYRPHLVFKPTRRTVYASALTIFASEGGRALPGIGVELKGRGLAPEIEVSRLPRIIRAAVGTSESLTVEITNKGEEPLTITSATAIHPLFMRIKPVALPITLAATGDSAEFEFRFTPVERGTTTTDILFVSNAINGPQTGTLKGLGLAPEVSVESVEFGNVRLGSSATRNVVVENTGDLPLTVSAPTWTNPVFSLDDPGVFPLIAESGESRSVTFRYTPPQNRRGGASATVTFATNAIDTQTTITLAGTGTAPEISVEDPRLVDFGDVRVGNSAERSVVIGNVGDEPLIISGVRPVDANSGGAGESVFSWVPPSPETLRQTAPAGTTLSFTLRFKPATPGEAVDNLMIDSDAFNMLEKNLIVKGSGVAPDIGIIITGTAVDKVDGRAGSIVSYDFGRAPVHAVASARVFISNEVGTVPLRVEIPGINDHSYFRWENVPEDGVVVVEAGKSTSGLILAFAPQTHGTTSTVLTFASDAFNDTRTAITLTAEGAGSEMEVRVNEELLAADGTRDLGIIRMDETTTVTVTVTNKGNADLEITDLRLSGEHYLSRDGPATATISGSDMPLQTNFKRFERTFKLSATGLATATLTIQSNDPHLPAYIATLTIMGTAPVIAVEVDGHRRGSGAEPYDFGAALIGGTTSRDVVIHNDGDAPLAVDSIAVEPEGSGFTVSGDRAAPVVIDSGSSETWTLFFKPRAGGDRAHTGMLVIDSDDLETQRWQLGLRGTGVEPEVGVEVGGRPVASGGEHDFGGVLVAGGPETAAVIVSNTGSAPLRVDSLVVSGAGYSLVDDGVGDIPPGSAREWLVRFAPTNATAPHTGLLTINSNDRDEGAYRVKLTGRGMAPEMEVEIADIVRQAGGDPHRFGQQRVGITASVAVRIKNTGNSSLDVTSIETTSTSAHFTFLDRPATAVERLYPPLSERRKPGYSVTDGGRRTIAAGSSSTFMLHFKPSVPSSEDNALLTIRSNDPEHPDWTLNLKGSGRGTLLRVALFAVDDPYKITNGGVYAVPDSLINRTPPVSVFVRLHSIGNIPVVIDSFAFESGSTDSFEFGDVKGNPGQNPVWAQYRYINFKPTRAGAHTATLVIRSNDDAFREFKIRLRGNGFGPLLDVSFSGCAVRFLPLALEGRGQVHCLFGDVHAGETEIATATLTNTGNRPLDITSIHDTPFDSVFFHLEGPVSRTIQAGDSHPWTIKFTPVAGRRGRHWEWLKIEGNYRNQLPQFDLGGDAVEPEVDVAVGGRPVASGGNYDFGEVLVAGGPETVAVIVSNTGNASLRVDSLVVSGAGYSLADDGVGDIPPGSAREWLVRFAPPNATAPHTGLLTINSNDHNEGAYRVNLRGRGTAPEMEVEIDDIVRQAGGDPYRFDQQRVGITASVAVRIKNTGNGSLDVTSIEATSTSAHFTFLDRPATAIERLHPPLSERRKPGYSVTDGGRRTIAAGSSSTFMLHFKPSVPSSEDNALLTIRSNDPEHPDWTLNLKGSGRGTLLHVTLFTPDAQHRITDAEVYDVPDSLINQTPPVNIRVRLHSMGNIPVVIDSFAFESTSTSFSRITDGWSNPDLTETWVQYKHVHFEPTRIGAHTATLVIRSNDDAFPEFKIRLRGNGFGPLLDVSFNGCEVQHFPSALEGRGQVHCLFGDVHAGETKIATATLTNTGNRPLNITSIHRTPYDSFFFHIVGPISRTIQAGDSHPWTIKFTPAAGRRGRHWEWLKIAGNYRNQLPQFDLGGDAVEPEVDVAVGGRPVASGGNYDFGEVLVAGGPETVAVIVSNTGNASLRVDSLVVSGAGYSLVDDGAGDIPAGSAREWLVRFAPTNATTPHTGLLTINSNDHNEGAYRVNLTGRGTAPEMEVEIADIVRQAGGDPYRFDQQRVGITASVVVRIKNTGNSSLDVTSIETTSTRFIFLDRPARAIDLLHPPLSERRKPGYSVTDSGRRAIAAGSSSTFMLHFKPSVPSSTDNALLTIRSNDPEHPDWTLNLKGSGRGTLLRVALFAVDSHYRITDAEVYDVEDRVVNREASSSLHIASPGYIGARAGVEFSEPPVPNAKVRLHSVGNIRATIDRFEVDDGNAGFFRIEDGWEYSEPDGVWGQYKDVLFEPTQRGIHTGTIVIESNDDTFPVFRIRLRGRGLAPGIDAQADDFGNVPIGGSSVTAVIVRNDGDAPLTIQGVEIAGNSPFSTDVVPSEFPVVPPGGSSMLNMSFAPVEPGISTAALTVTSDALDESTYTVVLRGNGVAPETTLDFEVGGQAAGLQTPYDFGQVRVGMTTAVTVVVSNRGSSSLRLEPRLAGAGYSLVNSGIRTVLSNSSATWMLRFRPINHTSTHQGALTIVNANHPANRWTLQLTGSGYSPRMKVEVAGNVYQSGTGGHNFGRISYGSSTTVMVKITNEGNSSLHIKSIRVTPEKLGYSAHYGAFPTRADFYSANTTVDTGYSLINSDIQTIPQGRSAFFALRFTPVIPIANIGVLTIVSDDPEHPEWNSNLTGHGTGPFLAVMSGNPMDFVPNNGISVRDRNVFSKADISIIPMNLGDSQLQIFSDDIAGEGFRGAWRYPSIFYPGVSIFPIPRSRFVPMRPGIHTGTFTIRSNDGINPIFTTYIQINVTAPRINVVVGDGPVSSTGEYNFGDIPVGGSSQTQVKVDNDGTGGVPLKITNIAVNGNGQFSAKISPSLLYPVTVPVEADPWPFGLSFAPTGVGPVSASLVIASNAYDEETYTIVLRGNGVAAAPPSAWAGSAQRSAIPTFQMARAAAAPELEVAIADAAQASDGAFNPAQGDGTTRRTVTIRNLGFSTLRISSATVGGDAFAADPSAGIRVVSAADMDISFTPTATTGVFSETLTLVSDGLPESFWTLRLVVGEGVRDRVLLGGPHGLPAEGATFADAAAALHEDVRFRDVGGGYIGGASPADALCAGMECGDRRVIYRLANPQVTTGAGSRRFRFDVELKLASSESAPVSFGAAGIGIRYNPDAFGGESFSACTTTDLGLTPQPRYGRAVNNPAENVTTWVWGNRAGGVADMPYGKVAPGYRGLVRIDCAIVDSTQLAGVGMDSFGWKQFQEYAPGNRYLRYAAHVENDLMNVALDGSPYAVSVDVDSGHRKVVVTLSEAVNPVSVGDFGLKNVAGGAAADITVLGAENAAQADTIVFTLSAAASTDVVITRTGAVTGQASGLAMAAADMATVPAYNAPAPGDDTAPLSEPAANSVAPRFVGLGYADGQSRLWLAFDKPVGIRTGAGTPALPDGTALSGFEVIANYTGGGSGAGIGVLRAEYRGGVAIDLARRIVSSDVSVWVRYTPPPVGRAAIYDRFNKLNRISTVRTFALQRSVTGDYDNDGIPDAMEARLGGNPLSANDAMSRGAPVVTLSRTGVAGSPVPIAYSAIRAGGAVAHLGVATTSGGARVAPYYLSDTFGYSGGYAEGVDGYGCSGQFPSNYASSLSQGGCARVDFNDIRAGVEHRIGWLVMNGGADAPGYWAVSDDTSSRLPEQVILRVPEFNMSRGSLLLAKSAAADATVRVGAFHDGAASLQPLTLSFSNVAAANHPSSSRPDGFNVSVSGGSTAGVVTSYALTGVRVAGADKLWRAGDSLSSLTADKYSLGRVTQTLVARLRDDSLPPLFGRASLYLGSTSDASERHAVVLRGTESHIALLPVEHTVAASAVEVSPWDGGVGASAAGSATVVVSSVALAEAGDLIRISFTASNPPATVKNTVSLKVTAVGVGATASTASTVLTWPVTDRADGMASAAGDEDDDGIADVRDRYAGLNRLPVSVSVGVTGSPDRSSAGADSWHHIRSLLPLHDQLVGAYGMRGGLSFHTEFDRDARIWAWPFLMTSRQQRLLPGNYLPGSLIQRSYSDFSASLSRDEFNAMAHRYRLDVAVVYNFRLHGVDPAITQSGSAAGGRAGVVIPLPESLYGHHNVFPLHYAAGDWVGDWTWLNVVGFSALQDGVCPDDSGAAGSSYRDSRGNLKFRKQAGDACMVVYLSDGGSGDRDGNMNGVVDALIGLAVLILPR